LKQRLLQSIKAVQEKAAAEAAAAAALKAAQEIADAEARAAAELKAAQDKLPKMHALQKNSRQHKKKQMPN
jgi:hypothetical protein